MKILGIVPNKLQKQNYLNLNFKNNNKKPNTANIIKTVQKEQDVPDLSLKGNIKSQIEKEKRIERITCVDGFGSDGNLYYKVGLDMKYCPKNGVLFKKADSNKERVFICQPVQGIMPYEGLKKNVRGRDCYIETCYVDGFPNMQTKYFHNIPYERELFDSNTHKRTYVRRSDGSFTLMQMDTGNNAKIEIETRNYKNNETRRYYFNASKSNNGVSSCKYEISSPDEYNKISMTWNPSGKAYQFIGFEEDKKTLHDSIAFIKKTIQSEEYIHDFGKTEELNKQLDSAIEYLTDKEADFEQ